MYATKRRRRNVKSIRSSAKDPPPKSNPSKRHRERLNAELDHLASLLPFEQSVISKLDKLSILRLAVSYLRTKSYFQAAIHERYSQENHLLHRLHHRIHHSHHLYSELGLTDSDSVLQALNGFLFVVTCDGEVFFASHTVEQYLGFHQSDIIHQSVLELIHSEDRDQFKLQLNWRSILSPDFADASLKHVLMAENSHVLQRCFTVRFRCLLDNTSGFITLEISGKLRLLQGQSAKEEGGVGVGGGGGSSLALFALCCPFGPLPIQDLSTRDYTFKSKHKMDMSPVSMDPRGKLFFGYSDRELIAKGGYDLVHTDDLSYYAAAHQELIKTGSSGLIAYRLLTKDFHWIWLQTSSKVIYKNSKPDFVICTHRHLTEDEGRDLARKRGSEFKLPYAIIDNDPSSFSSLTSEDDVSKVRSSRNKKSKSQLRDYLQAGRKRKAPYRELYHSLNIYAPYPNGGFADCGAVGEVKSDSLTYSYTGQNFTFDAVEQYRFGYHTFTAAAAGAIYRPSSGSTPDGFSFETDRYGYASGYYLDARGYPYNFQCHANNYSDIVAHAASKYKQNIVKYGYGDSSGLDLSSKPNHMEHEFQQCTDIDRQTYRTNHVNGEKLSLVGGMLDPMVSGCLYGSNSLRNNSGLLSCTMAVGNSNSPYDNVLSYDMFHNHNSVCSSFQSDHPSVGDRYIETTAGEIAPKKSMSSMNGSQLENDNSVSNPLLNGHRTVICHSSPRKSVAESEKFPDQYAVNVANEPTSVAPTTPWSSYNKNEDMTARDTLLEQAPLPPPPSSFALSHDCRPQDKDGIVSQVRPTSNSSFGMATSVIQMTTRNRSYEKDSVITGSFAVPVAKSSWLCPAGSSQRQSTHLSVHQVPEIPQSELLHDDTHSHSSCICNTKLTNVPTVVKSTKATRIKCPMCNSAQEGLRSKFPADKEEDVTVDHQSNNPLLHYSKMTHMLLNSCRQ